MSGYPASRILGTTLSLILCEKQIQLLINMFFKVFYHLFIKNINFHFLLFYYCLLTSADSNFTFLSHKENKLIYQPLILKIFTDLLLENCGVLTIVYSVFQFFREIKLLRSYAVSENVLLFIYIYICIMLCMY